MFSISGITELKCWSQLSGNVRMCFMLWVISYWKFNVNGNYEFRAKLGRGVHVRGHDVGAVSCNTGNYNWLFLIWSDRVISICGPNIIPLHNATVTKYVIIVIK